MMQSKMSEYRFDNYFGGRVNSETVAAMRGLAAPSATHPRVTILEGKSGTGKTHLLRALQSESSCSNIKYISIGEINRLAGNATAEGSAAFHDLTDQLVNTDLLLIDDVMYAAGREFTAWYLLEIIKRMNPNSLIVLAGDIVLEEFIRQITEITSSIQHLRLYFPESDALRRFVWYTAYD